MPVTQKRKILSQSVPERYMSGDVPSEMSPDANRRIAESRSPGGLRMVALIAATAGAAGSVGLMLIAGHPPIFLRILFAIWVASPFAALVLAGMVSKRWSLITRTTLYRVTLLVAICSLAIYGYVVLRPHEATPTAVFVAVPPASWLFVSIGVLISALMSGRRSRGTRA